MLRQFFFVVVLPQSLTAIARPVNRDVFAPSSAEVQRLVAEGARVVVRSRLAALSSR